MITDTQTNKVYFSTHLKKFKCWENIREALESEFVEYGFLPGTKDIWVRDFMPIQIQTNHFIDYTYSPDYLKDEHQYATEDRNACYDFIGSNYQFLKLIVDGGNCIKCGNKLILTDKIFLENKHIEKKILKESLEKAFSAEVIFIPWDKSEPYGHADGMVRFVNPGHVVINHYKDYDVQLRTQLLDILSKNFDTIDELSFGSDARSKSWAHLNFLRVGDKIFVPQLAIPSDIIAIKQIQDIYTTCKVVPVFIDGIVRKGGGLNCVTWNIQEEVSPCFHSSYEHYAEVIHDILVTNKDTKATVAELFDIMVNSRCLSFTNGLVFLPDMSSLTWALWDSIKKHKQIIRKSVFPNDAIIGYPYNIPYEFHLKES